MTVDSKQLDAILAEFVPGRQFLLTSHSRPDGDAIGSLLGLAAVLDQLGCLAKIIVADPVPATCLHLPGADRIVVASSAPVDQPDMPCIILECDSIARTGLAGLEGRFLINVDHHRSGRAFSDLNWIDPDACAVGAMIYDLALAAGVTITPEIATCLYTAIVSDTVGFTSQATTARTLAIVAELANLGASPASIARELYFSSPECRVRLLGSALVNMQRRGPVAWSWATLDDLQRLHAEPEDCEGVVNYLIGIAGVEAAFFLRELPDTGSYRLSLRSKSLVDVSRIAESFGGGGHRAASGCTLDGSLDHVISRVLEKVERDSVSLG